MEKKDELFVVSQIGDEGTLIRKRADVIADLIVEPVALDFGLKTERSDRDPTPGPITPQILKSILSSRAVVVDLTGRNPNVYYELCFAHSFGVPVVMLVDKTSSLPFDIKDERVISIGDNEGTIDMPAGEEAKKKLRDALNVVLEEGYEPRSIVTEVASVQNIESMSPADPVASELAALNRRIEQVYEKVSSSAARSSSAYRIIDLQQLTNFVSHLAVQRGIVSKADLDNLITETTSDAFDDWVAETKRKVAEEDINEEDFDDVPF